MLLSNAQRGPRHRRNHGAKSCVANRDVTARGGRAASDPPMLHRQGQRGREAMKGAFPPPALLRRGLPEGRSSGAPRLEERPAQFEVDVSDAELFEPGSVVTVGCLFQGGDDVGQCACDDRVAAP